MLNYRSSRILCSVNKDLLKFSTNGFSSKGKDPKTVKEVVTPPSADETQWNGLANWELLGLTGYRFCLPGNVGLPPERKPRNGGTGGYKKVARPKKVPRIVRLPETSYMRHMEIVAQLSALANELSFIPNEPKKFKCKAVDCPHLLRDQVTSLFPHANIGQGPLTAVCVALRIFPKNFEEDWQNLVNLFEETARRVCTQLIHEGYWADYPTNVVLPADPKSAAQIEAALNLSSPGLRILKHTGCILLVHAPFGESKIVGWLFTTAPYDEPKLAKVLKAENL